MKRKKMTSSLKRALAFALFCLCIFVYSQQTSVLGSTAVAEEEQCCKHCGSEAGCLGGSEWLQSAWEDCEMDYDDDYNIIGCEVQGEHCDCNQP
jgi:hypothetical protein